MNVDDKIVVGLAADGQPVAMGIASVPSEDDLASLVEAVDGLPVGAKVQQPDLDDKVMILMGADGNPVAVKFGCFCPNDNPSIDLMVTGASGTITWCGETWSLPGDSGIEKRVCPTAYNKGLTTFTTPTYTYSGLHSWIFQDTKDELHLLRWARWTAADPVLSNYLELNTSAGASARNQKASWTTNSTPAGFSPINGVAIPTKSDYDITDEFFSSVTISGITYSWSRGDCWP